MVLANITAKEELLTLLPMKEHTQGDEIPIVQIVVHHHGRCTRDGWPLKWIYCQVQVGLCSLNALK